MTFTKSLLSTALLALTAFGSAQAAVQWVPTDSGNDAGQTYGSTDTFDAPVVVNLNGTSGTVLLETLDPGLAWSNFTLLVRSVYDTQTTPVALFGGLTGTLTKIVDADVGNNKPLQGFDYTFTFAGTLNPGFAALTLNGFGGNGVLAALTRGGSVSLMTTAIPEPESYAMMLAGLGVLGFTGRRRKSK